MFTDTSQDLLAKLRERLPQFNEEKNSKEITNSHVQTMKDFKNEAKGLLSQSIKGAITKVGAMWRNRDDCMLKSKIRVQNYLNLEKKTNKTFLTTNESYNVFCCDIEKCITSLRNMGKCIKLVYTEIKNDCVHWCMNYMVDRDLQKKIIKCLNSKKKHILMVKLRKHYARSKNYQQKYGIY